MTSVLNLTHSTAESLLSGTKKNKSPSKGSLAFLGKKYLKLESEEKRGRYPLYCRTV